MGEQNVGIKSTSYHCKQLGYRAIRRGQDWNRTKRFAWDMSNQETKQTRGRKPEQAHLLTEYCKHNNAPCT